MNRQKNFIDNGKLGENQGRKAKGPVKWQPATKGSFLFLRNKKPLTSIDNGKLGESQGRKAKGPVKWQPATKRKLRGLK